MIIMTATCIVESDIDHLNISNIKEVLDEMWDYRARWKFIGIELGIEKHTLDAIEATCLRNVDNCLCEMIGGWLKNVSPRPTRGAVRAALHSKSVSNATGSFQHNAFIVQYHAGIASYYRRQIN